MNQRDNSHFQKVKGYNMYPNFEVNEVNFYGISIFTFEFLY